MDVTDCRELVSLQAVIFMILFLQCSAKLATCYAFIGVALRSAIRMGMHRSFKDSFSPIESEMRKRCFWIIRKMDVFVGAMLGLPLALIDDEIDQDYPSEVDDEFITLDGIKHQPRDKTPLIAATNHDFRLTAIVCKIVKCIYPIKGFQSTGQEAPRVYRVRLSMIKDIEKDLKAWEDNLQPIFKPGRDVNPKYMRYFSPVRLSDQAKSPKGAKSPTHGICSCANDVVSPFPPLCFLAITSRYSTAGSTGMCNCLCSRLAEHHSHYREHESKWSSCWFLLVHDVHILFRGAFACLLRARE